MYIPSVKYNSMSFKMASQKYKIYLIIDLAFNRLEPFKKIQVLVDWNKLQKF